MAVGKSASDTQFTAFQENLDTATQGYVKMPGSESPKEVRQRVEAEAAKKAGATHVYDSNSGQAIPADATPVKNWKGQIIGYKEKDSKDGQWVTLFFSSSRALLRASSNSSRVVRTL